MSGGRKNGNHFPVQIAPRGLTVQTEKDVVSILRAFIQIVHAQTLISR